MDIHIATEESYNNGYAKGFEDGKREAEMENKIFSALRWNIWYNGHYRWLMPLRERLEEHPRDEVVEDITTPDEFYTDRNAIAMILALMFGGSGLSSRTGYIDDIDGCIRFIDKIMEGFQEDWDAR